MRDIGNNGILVWTSAPGEDGSIVVNNRVERVGAKEGGSGENGNGINVYRAGSVLVSGNRVSDCAFSGIRNNSGSNCQIMGNSISRCGEVAIYSEFAFEGAVVSGNLIEDVAAGISITNFDKGGRLAVVANNVVRNVKGGGSLADTTGFGIYVEADAQVSGNVVELGKGYWNWNGLGALLPQSVSQRQHRAQLRAVFHVLARRRGGAGDDQRKPHRRIDDRRHSGHGSQGAGDRGPGRCRSRGAGAGFDCREFRELGYSADIAYVDFAPVGEFPALEAAEVGLFFGGPDVETAKDRGGCGFGGAACAIVAFDGDA